MKTHLRFLSLFLVLLALGFNARAQLTGTKTIPSTNYPTLKVAIDSLNLYGVGTGGVIINFSSASTETAPVGGYQLGSATLNASTSSGKTITINGNGTVISAYVGTSTSADGMFYIMGTDWVTINGLNLAESSANTTTTTQMEWGYSLVKLSSTAPFDGCQNDVITNSTINLTKTYTNTIGIRAAHSIAGTTSVLTTTGATAASTNSYNKFTGNVINNTTRGIQLIGISSPVAVYDKANVIGGSSSNLGNTITVGGTTNTGYGTWTQYDSVITISNNSFFVNTTQGNTGVYEVYMSTGCGDLTVTNNLFDVNVNMSSASMYAYWNSSSHTDPGAGLSAASTHNISNNTITGNNPVATSSYLYGLYESSVYSQNLLMNGNQIKNIDWNTSTGYLYLFYQYLTQSPNTQIQNNTIYNISQRQTTTSGYIYGYYLYNYNSPTGTFSVQNNTFRKIKSNYYVYAYYCLGSYTTPPTGYAGQMLKSRNNITDSVDLSTSTTGYCMNYMCYYGFDSSECINNRVTNIQGSLTGTSYIYFYTYGGYATNKFTVKSNLVNNITGFNLYCYLYMGYYGTLVDSNTISNVTWTGTGGGMTNMLGYYGANYISSNNRVNNITAGGGSVANYMGMYGSDAIVRYNAITNITLNNAAYIYNYIGYNPTNCEVHHCRVDSITQGTSTTFYPWYSYAAGFLKIHDCILSNLTTNSTSLTWYPYYLYSSSATTPVTFYNNFLTNVNLPSGYANTNSAGIYLASTAPYTLFHNTIRINPGIPGGAGYGFTGIYYPNTAILDLRNNIINVNVTPTSGGYTTALRRSTGSAGVTPSNFLGTSNSNIYYAPNVTNSWLYGEGTSAASMVNTYNMTNDPNFNTPCGLFKSFMGHDQASFAENNLAVGSIAATYVPAGTSYAEKGAVPTANPTVTTDFSNLTRGAVADIGALEFNGSALDNAPPIISYTPIPVASYCSTSPTLTATITDNSGVNNTMSTPTTTGSAPRLYFKKSSELNAFGANNSATNGWKWAEPTSISGSTYIFDFNYSLLTSSVGPGDSIMYFVIAQDLASPVNAGASVIGFPVCPGSVQLTSTHAPTNSAPVPNGFKILNTPTFLAKAFPGSSCGPGNTVYNITPLPVGAGVQWQSATLTGSFSNISGATSPTYSTPTNTATTRYRALILCGSSTLATTALDTFVIAAPAILSTVGDTVCGYDTMYLSALVTPFTTAKWYTTSTGGTSFYSGNNYKVNPRTTSVTYYVSANTPNASTEMVSKTPPVAYTYSALDGAGLEMRFRNPATNFYSTTVYPWNASGSFNVELRDSLDNPIPGYSAGPFTISGGAGTTPVVLQLNWKNIPAGRYWLVQTNISGSPYMNMEYNSLTYPYNSPSGNVSILSGRYSTSPYYAFFYYNIVGADCESTAPRVQVTGTVTPAPAITVSSPNVPGICLGSSATLNVASPNTSYVFTWTSRPGATTLTGATQTITPTSSATYDLVAFDPYTGCKNYDSVRINVNPVPNPPTIAPINPTICGGKPVQLIAVAPPGSAGVQTIGTGTVVMNSPPNPFYGFYTGNRSQYLIKSAELFAAGVKPGQLTSLAFQAAATGYTLNNLEIRLANVSLAAINTSITCFTGMTLVYTQASFTPPASGWATFVFNQPTTFNWSGGDLVVDVANINCPSCPTTACTNYSTSASVYGSGLGYTSSFQVYYDGNCGIVACPTSGSYFSVSSTTRPNMQIGYREPLSVNWLNVSRLFKNSTLTTPVTLTDTNSIVYAAPTTTTVYTAVTNASGCLSVPSLPDTVKVIPAPNVLVTPAGPQTICAGAPVTLCIPTGVNQTYQWYLNNVAISGANANCYVAGAAGSYRVAATNVVTGCADTSIPTVLTVNPVPVVTISANGPTTVCNGTGVGLTANSGTAVAWQWQLNGANITGQTGSGYTATASGSYTVLVTNTVGCSVTSAPTVVTVNTTPGTVTPQSSTSFCTGGSVVLQAPVGTGFTYQWYVGTSAIAGATTSSYTATTTGNYYVIVTNPATGCSTTSAPIPVTAGAGPNSAITPQGTVSGCQKGSVTLQAVAQPGLCYQWNRNGTPIAGANSDNYVATTAGSYTVTVTICAQPSCISTTATPTVLNLNPLPNATVTPSSVNPFCQGDSVVFSANTGVNLSYQWYQNGSPISGATGSNYAAKSNGSYQVMVTNTTTGCSDTNTSIAISVKPAPNSTITAAGNPTFCQGGSVVLNAASSGITGYQWYLNGNVITGSTGTAASYTATGTGLYTVQVTGTNGCTALSIPASVQVNALPNVVTVPSGTAAVCQGYTTILSVPSGPGLTYQWYNGTTAISGATNSTYTTGTGGTYNVLVTNTVTGCFATSGNIVLSVNTPPIATAAATGSTTICQSDSVKLSANTGTGFFYQWKLNGVDLAGATGSVYYAQAAGRYTVAVSNATNCTTLSNSIQIQVNPRPAAYITYNTPLEFCDGSAVVLTANSGTGLSYQWYMDGVPLPNTSSVNVSAKSGAYTLKVTNSFGCFNTADTLDVTVWPTPVPAIVAAGTTLSTSQPYASYQWFFNNNAIGGATSATYNYTQNGAYKVRVIDDNGCEGYSNQFFINNVGITQTAAGKSIRVYPNPSSNIVHIDAPVKIKVVLRDVTGRSVLEDKNVTEIDMSDIATGPYLLYITDMEGQLLRIEKLTKSDR